MIYIQSFTFNTLAENTYLIYDDTKHCMVVDPGCYTSQEEEQLVSFIKKKKLIIKYLINTHCHIDHVVGNAFIKNKYQVPLSIHPLEKESLALVASYASMYDMENYISTIADVFLDPQQVISLGNYRWKILEVPGHSKGHIALYEEKNKVCISGDVLFENSIGRTDLPGGNHDILMRSIQHTLFLLDDCTKIYPGHGNATTIGKERKYNPWCKV